MTPATTITPEARSLVESVCDGMADDAQFRELQSLLRTNIEVANYYVDLVGLDAELQWLITSQRDGIASFAEFMVAEKRSSEQPPFICPLPIRSTVATFSDGAPFAYLLATVITALGLLIAAFTYVPQAEQLVGQRPKNAERSVASTQKSQEQIVGRVTGMVGCKWNDASQRVMDEDEVSLGQKYALASGLLEITYDTGAKVILQGPVTYTVESATGGYLSVGKLTAKLEKGSRIKVQGPTSELATSHQPLATDLFAVRTPTAVVTDLGTEFGVEVAKDGNTMSHVYRGSIKLELLGDARTRSDGTVVLRENESARTVNVPGGSSQRVSIRRVDANPRLFARDVPCSLKRLDLLDIVAGGNGTQRNCEHGIDPNSGMEDTSFVVDDRKKSEGYHRVYFKSRFIDGVFIPDGATGPVMLDSAGHAFDGFPRTSGMSHGSIWARSPNLKADDRANDSQQWVYAMGRGDAYMPAQQGLLGLHPNTGITFDLQAMREAYPRMTPCRFRAVAGVVRGETPVDFWVFADGRLKLRRSGLRREDGPVRVDVELRPSERFLTIVSTTGENIRFAWFVLGDPMLEMASTEDAQLP
jgi:hypothetical protein